VPSESESIAENRLEMGLLSDAVLAVDDVPLVLDVADVVLDAVLVVVPDVVPDVAEDCCCIPISTPRIMLDSLGLVLPVSPPSAAAVVVVVDWVDVELVVSEVEVVSSLVSRLDRI